MGSTFSLTHGIGGRLAIGLIAGLGTATAASANLTLLTEDFSTDPTLKPNVSIVGDTTPSRFTHDAATGQLTAAYDTAQPTTKMLWALPQLLTQNTSFRYSVDFTLKSDGYYASPFASQIAFGLINSLTTGADRPGGSGTGGYAYDIVTVDYFPGDAYPDYNFHTLAISPTVVQTAEAEQGYYDQLVTDFTTESQIDGAGETHPLPLDTALTATLSYDHLTRWLTLHLADANGGLTVNLDGLGSAGGYDNDPSTIQVQLPGDATFNVDSFALTLWEDTYGGGTSTILADVAFDGFEVVLLPEPTVALMGGLLGLTVLTRRTRRA